MNNNILQNIVFLEPEHHVYFDKEGKTYTSVSRVLSEFAEKADFKKIAGFVANKRLKKYEELSIKTGRKILDIALDQPKYSRAYTQKTVLAEWDLKRDEAAEAGTYIHNNMEQAILTGKYPQDDYVHYYKWSQDYFTQYKEVLCEQALFHPEYRIAGTGDKICFRTSRKGMVDVRDYKSNDLGYDSTGKDQFTKAVRHYNRYMTGPLSHLEDCDFNKYALQLSIYMYMLECMGYKPGNLAIIQVEWKKIKAKPKLIYLPYMKHEVIALLEYRSKNTKKDIEIVSSDYHEIVGL